jgi:hypothetical protein
MSTLARLPTQTVNAPSQSALLLFLGVGLTLIFGLMRIVNFTHGGLYLRRMSIHKRPHPEEPRAARRLEGWGHAPRPLPFLRDARLRRAPQDEVCFVSRLRTMRSP